MMRKKRREQAEDGSDGGEGAKKKRVMAVNTMIQNFGGDGLSHYSVWFELHQADFFMV